jgi:eukaryotic-like serine/threonine-protein kinase
MGLLKKAQPPLRIAGKVGWQNLQRHGPAQLQILGEVDLSHAARAELLFDPVMADIVRHESLALTGCSASYLSRPISRVIAYSPTCCNTSIGVERGYLTVQQVRESKGRSQVAEVWEDLMYPRSNPMTIAPGTRLGPYEIAAPLAAGGMGEVFRGRDTRLGRDVAIKILPQDFSRNEQFLARFEREAKTISSLNHPNICTLFDVGNENGTHFLVMEMIEGESLADRLQKGALPIEQVLRYGAQVADALDRAHKQGIIHRDLKPANVMLTKTGAKLLDFGLARPASDSAVVHGMTEMPTQAKPLTQEGTILGTFQYMAPEQLEGQEADARTDIFAFGALLYELSTGKRAFQGSSKTSLISAIVSSQPQPISSVVPMTPPALDHVVRKCLEKDPEDRWQSAHDIASELRWISEAGSQAGVATTVTVRRKSRERIAWTLAALLAVTSGIMAFVMARAPRPQIGRLSVSAPPEVAIVQQQGNVAVSPDGRRIVFVASDTSGRGGLWVRSLSDTTPRLLPNTSDATYPFWSPDSQHIAFFAEGKLRRVPAAGGDVDEICAATDGRGGAWSSRGVILFAPTVGSALMRVAADGGEPSPVTEIDPSKKEDSHRFPSFLPGGERFLFYAMDSGGAGNIKVGSLDSLQSTQLLKAERSAVYVAPGYIIYGNGDRILARRFDAKSLRILGEPERLPDAAPAWVHFGDRVASVSENGVMVIAAAPDRNMRLVWLDRQGQTVGTIPLPAGRFATPRFSPDGTQAALEMRSGDSLSDLWVVDLERGATTRLTFGPALNSRPIWSPDGKRIVFQSNRKGPFDLYVRQLSGAEGDTPLYASPMNWKEPYSWSPDGSTVAFAGLGEESGFDIMLAFAANPAEATMYLQTPASEGWPMISPDGRWLAYTSNESGRFEIYVQSFPTPGKKYQVTTSGGNRVYWTHQGRELVYASLDGTFGAVPVTPGEGLQFGAPVRLFSPSRNEGIDVSPDGQRFLAVIPANAANAQSLTVVLNWAEGLKK